MVNNIRIVTPEYKLLVKEEWFGLKLSLILDCSELCFGCLEKHREIFVQCEDSGDHICIAQHQ